MAAGTGCEWRGGAVVDVVAGIVGVEGGAMASEGGIVVLACGTTGTAVDAVAGGVLLPAASARSAARRHSCCCSSRISRCCAHEP